MKKFIIAAFVFFYFLPTAFSQPDIAHKYAGLINELNLKKQLHQIASPEMQGRKTGTAGQRMAADYIRTQFRNTGIMAAFPGGYEQVFPSKGDTLIPTSFLIENQKFDYGLDYVLLSGESKKEPFKAKEMVFAGYGIDDSIYNDYSGKNVKGKVVLVIDGEPIVNGKYLISGTSSNSKWSANMTEKARVAAAKGAVALLLINPNWDSIPGLVGHPDQTLLFFPKADKVANLTTLLMPKFELAKIFGNTLADSIIKTMKNNGRLNNFKIDKKLKSKLSFGKIETSVDGSNIIGIIEGNEKKDEYVILSAHYDHVGKIGSEIFYGADDNGSGVAGLIEMAGAFSKAKQEGHGPKRTMVFIAFCGEEEGLLGSHFYANNPVFPLIQTSADLNIDMIGRIDKKRGYKTRDYVYMVGNDKRSSDLTPVVKSVNAKYGALRLDEKYNDPADPQRLFYRSDHYNLAAKGVPVIFFTSGLHEDYHKTSDTVDKINFDLLEKRTKLIFLTAWEIANRNEMLQRDLPIPKS